MSARIGRSSAPDYLRLTDISITFTKGHNFSDTLDVRLDDIPRMPVLSGVKGQTGKWAWRTGSMEVSPQSSLIVRAQTKRNFSFRAKGEPLTIPISELFDACREQSSGHKIEWTKDYPKFSITIGISLDDSTSNVTPRSPEPSDPLQPTTDDIMNICPRFRILVIGKTGVGKSSLINQAFGVSEASVSKGKPGVHDINFEIESQENTHFVVHDSQGFEPGEEDNFRIATNFIEDRKRKRDLRDKLHAIWLCIEIPCAGGRVFETGDENFIKLHLGHVPVIIVFTKFDQLVTLKHMQMCPARRRELKDNDKILAAAREDAEVAFQEVCLVPLQEVVQEDVLYIKVSAEEGYHKTLSDLIDLTYTNVKKYVAEEASLVSAIAQRTSPETKIYASIAVGKRKYWDSLGTSAKFPGRTLKSCLEVIHTDIVVIWNFPDPKIHLQSNEFKALMSNIVSDLANHDLMDPNKSLVAGLSIVGTIGGIVAALSGPAAPIVVPIVAGFVFAKWAYDVYQQSHGVLRCLMAYIVDLTIIMQILFVLKRSDHKPLTRRLIKLTTRAYIESTSRATIHNEIRTYVDKQHVFARANRDEALAKIVDLIERLRMDAAQMEDLKTTVSSGVALTTIAGTEDESWDAQN